MTNTEIMGQDGMQQLMQLSDFALAPCEMQYDFEDRSRFQKMELTSGQKIQISSLMHQIPTAMAASILAPISSRMA